MGARSPRAAVAPPRTTRTSSCHDRSRKRRGADRPRPPRGPLRVRRGADVLVVRGRSLRLVPVEPPARLRRRGPRPPSDGSSRPTPDPDDTDGEGSHDHPLLHGRRRHDGGPPRRGDAGGQTEGDRRRALLRRGRPRAGTRHLRRSLSFSAGQANDSRSSDNVLRIEIHTDGASDRLVDIAFDEVKPIEVDVSNVNALKIVMKYQTHRGDSCSFDGSITGVVHGLRLKAQPPCPPREVPSPSTTRGLRRARTAREGPDPHGRGRCRSGEGLRVGDHHHVPHRPRPAPSFPRR